MRSKIVSNSIHLLLLQILTYVLPLVTTPYLIRVLGVDNYGQIMLAMSAIVYVNIITDYGFKLTATKQISQCGRGEISKLSDIFSRVIYAKVFINFICFIIYFSILIMFDIEREIRNIFLLAYGMTISQLLLPVWFFQGIQEMKYISIFNGMSKLFYTLCIFLFLNSEDDTVLVPLINSSISIIFSLLSVVFAFRKYNLFICPFSFTKLKDSLFDGWYIFLQQLYSSLYGPINVLLLGYFTTNTIVGTFSIAQTLVSIPGMVVIVVGQAIYPHMSKLYTSDKVGYFCFLKKIAIAIIAYSILSTVMVYFIGSYAIEIFVGEPESNVNEILDVLLLGLLFSSFSQLITQVYVTTGKERVLSKISFFVMVCSLILSPFTIYNFGVIGLSIYIVLRQSIVFFLSLFFLRKVINE
ncbi:oligosaccharide flippase family protein [Vibrio sp. Isolate30]|uniref:oligosaccharide flippase family protein n=1 Tax=Vibrio sp. Isolate30 TaxID=2908536 RepID=UPI001EFE3382|nr:oligosaccharide flippase family protein [Vibrio sp. Isolate30]MCG9632636.1 oligosaccharide flippase family protein [Vibrio sp. Isolate30]